tara:strand:+ start:3696 stop:4805 length:1110 start_codon:yes stop_codon:yes gene_type:complete
MNKNEQRVFPDENGKCPVGYHKMPPDANHKTEWCMEGDEHPTGSTYSRDVDTKPTEEMARLAKKGLKWREEFNRGGTEVGVARARDISNRDNLSESTIKRMVSFFARHRVDLDAPAANPEHEDYPSAGVIAWLLWGGDNTNPDGAGYGWALKKSEEFDKEENEMTVKEKEVRICNVLKLSEVRNEDGVTTSKKIVGYPVVFNSLSNDLGGFVEKVERGAFTESLKNNDEVHALFNHDSDKVLGRRGSGTLKLWEDDYGLRMELDPPNTTLGNDVVELLNRGDLVSMSFGFYDVDDSWEVRDGANVRTINSARLFDVSIVLNPAYNQASVQLAHRSLEKFQAEKEVEQSNLDAAGKQIDLSIRLRLAEQE